MSSKPGEFIVLESPLQHLSTVESVERSDADTQKHAEANGSAENKSQGFGPSISAWEQLKKTNRTRIIIASVIAVLIGIILGAGVTAIIFTQTSNTKKDVPSPLPTTVAVTTMETTVAQSSTNIIVKEVTTAVANRANCDVKYKGKCFHAIVTDDLTIHVNQSNMLCETAGLQLANIYSGSHYFMIEGYLRSKFPMSGYISAWTAMNMIPDDRQIVLSTGKNITLRNARWHSGYPSKDVDFTHVGIDVLRLPTQDNVDRQGMWNYNPLWDGNSALCEEF